MKIDLSCRTCGSNHFSLEEAETDATLVSCRECGRTMGTLGELKERVGRLVLSRSRRDREAP